MKGIARLLLIQGLLAVGVTAAARAQIIDPNIGFCAPPSSATACSGQPDTNPIASGGAIGMWSFGEHTSSDPWYLILAIPVGTYTSSTAPQLTSSSFNSGDPTSPSFLTTGSSTPSNFNSGSIPTDIYSYLGAQVGNLSADNSMNTTNMFGGLEQHAFGSIPSYFQLLVYTFTTGNIIGNTSYSFISSTPLPPGTFLAAVADGGQQFSTPFTTAGLVTASTPEPPALSLMSSGLLLLLGVLCRRYLAVLRDARAR